MSDPYDVDLTFDSESRCTRGDRYFPPRIMTARHVCPIPRSPQPHLNGSSGFTEDPPPPRNRCSLMPAIAGREQGRALLHVTRLRGDNTRAARTCISNERHSRERRVASSGIHPSIRPSIHSYPSIHPSSEASARVHSQLCDLARSTCLLRTENSFGEFDATVTAVTAWRNFAAASAKSTALSAARATHRRASSRRIARILSRDARSELASAVSD